MTEDEKNKILVTYTSGQMEQMEKMNRQLVKNSQAMMFFLILTMALVIILILGFYSAFHDNQYISRAVTDLDRIAGAIH